MERAVRCHLIRAAGTPPIVVVVVDDRADDELTAAFASETAVPSPRFWGVWGTNTSGDALAFRLIDRDTHRERTWWQHAFGPPLLGAILEIPHVVVVFPRAIADARKLADATSADVVGLLRSLRDGLFVRVTEQSDHVRELHGHKVVGAFEGYITYE
ncbi:MAG TPA: hypothetical protein VI300_19175 [Solirubrobacter sp.]